MEGMCLQHLKFSILAVTYNQALKIGDNRTIPKTKGCASQFVRKTRVEDKVFLLASLKFNVDYDFAIQK